MKKEKLSPDERKILKRQERPAIMLAVGLLFTISILNLAMYYQDVLLGTEGVERPPVSQLIVIQVFAVLLAFVSFYFPSKKLIKDLSTGLRYSEELVIAYKFVQNKDSKRAYTLKMQNSLMVLVDQQFFKSVQVGDVIEVQYVPESLYVFGAKQ